jgi:hypothetical protein
MNDTAGVTTAPGAILLRDVMNLVARCLLTLVTQPLPSVTVAHCALADGEGHLDRGLSRQELPIDRSNLFLAAPPC